MQDIHSGLVVVAGGNRAGKTTLMQALRYLGYGLPRRPNLPPSSGNMHLIVADVVHSNGERYTIQLSGYGAPKVSPLEGSKPVTIGEIFGGVDSYTYKQVFTISLDELRRIPEDTLPREEEHLRAVLLGGGWSDTLRLMSIKQEFAKKAQEIGGKKGAKSTGQFKPWFQDISEGIELRNSANMQIDQFYQLKALLASERRVLAELEQALEQKQQELELHELIRDHIETYRQIARLSDILEDEDNLALIESFPANGQSESQRLLEEYPQALEKFELLSRRFAASTGTDSPEALLEYAETIDLYEKQLSGWRHEAKSLEDAIKEHKQTEAEMLSDLRLLNSTWEIELSEVATLPLDVITEEKLLVLIDDYSETVNSLKDKTEEIEEVKMSLADKEKQALSQGGSRHSRPYSVFILTAVGLAAVLIAAMAFGPLEAVGAGVAAGAGILAYVVLYNSLGSKASRRELLEGQLKELREKLTLLEKQKSALEERLEQSESELKRLLQSLNLPENLPYTALPDFLRGIRDLRRRYNSWIAKREQINEQIAKQDVLKTRLKNLLVSLGLGTKDLELDGTKPLEGEHKAKTNVMASSLSQNTGKGSNEIGEMFDLLETACTQLSLARELKVSQLEKDKLEREAFCLLQKSGISSSPDSPSPDTLTHFTSGRDCLTALNAIAERAQQYEKLKQDRQTLIALETGLKQVLTTPRNRKLIKAPELANADELVENFGKLCSEFASAAAAQEALETLADELRQLREAVREKQNSIPAIEERLHQLNSDEQLLKANRIISEARRSLEEKAEEYAVFRLAELMTNELYNTLMEETKGQVLGGAGELLEKITSGEYAAIDLPDEGGDRDFLAIPAGKGEGLCTSALSRGTREQLFLSVRLSRIKGITPPLPVILDDSMANFDPVHTRNTVEIIAQLAESHQVFVLTCHPELLEMIEKTGCAAQYWGLQKGMVSGPFENSNRIKALLVEGNTNH